MLTGRATVRSDRAAPADQPSLLVSATIPATTAPNTTTSTARRRMDGVASVATQVESSLATRETFVNTDADAPARGPSALLPALTLRIIHTIVTLYAAPSSADLRTEARQSLLHH